MKMPDFDVETVVILGLAMSGGALGGSVRYFGAIEKDLRVILAGIVAAFIMIIVTHPTDWVGLVAGAVAAGYASDVVLAGYVLKGKLENAKLETQLATQQAKKAKQNQNAAESDLGLAIGALKALGGPEGLELGVLEGQPVASPTAALAAKLEAAQKARAADV